MREKQTETQARRAEFTLYHANAKGSGAAMTLQLQPATDREDGVVWMSLARQRTVAAGAASPYARFDWEGKIVVKLGFADVVKLLQVFRGEIASLEGTDGIFHQTRTFSTQIRLRRTDGAKGGCAIDVRRADASGGEKRARIALSAGETFGLAEAIASSLGALVFGVPPWRGTLSSDARGAGKEASGESAA
jgi:hypothetical protein